MKRNPYFLVFFASLLMITLFSCEKSDEYSYEALSPVYMKFNDFRQPLKTSSAKTIKQSGKIYFKDNYIFINEVNEGIHVIDNTFPASPQNIAFYEILGNVDMAIRGNILFADSYIDLVAIDIKDILNPREVGRIANAFPEVLPVFEDASIPYAWHQIDRTKGVIVGWKKTTLTQEYGYYRWWGWGRNFAFMDAASGRAENSAGVAGSMARFMLNDHFLYSVAQPHVLKTIDVSNASKMLATDSIYTWREMETLFKYKNNLFIGTTTGMVVYSLEKPEKPEFLSELNHINACDPVVVENDIAYVTLRSGNFCRNIVNQLDVIDVSDIKKPKLLKSYPMFNPHGLGVDNGMLFICDGAAGLKVYNASNPLAVQSNMIVHFEGIDAFDVIPLGNILLLIGQDGLFQYDYSDRKNLVLLSHIKVARK
jgi:hypothetical protein